MRTRSRVIEVGGAIDDHYANLTPIHLFVDDTAILLTINSQEDSLKLQADLQRLEVWERDWDMSFNPDKCKVLRISRKRQDIISTTSFMEQF